MPRRNIKGFIDPISIIGVLMLVITLVVGTKVVNDKGFSLNIVEQAAGTKKTGNTAYDKCREESGRERCNEKLGINVNWKGEIVNEIDTSNVPKDYSGKTCDANGTQYSGGAVVMYGGIDSYATCGEDGKWNIGVGTITDIKPENVPEYAKETYKQAFEAKKADEAKTAQQQATEPVVEIPTTATVNDNELRNKSVCLQEGGFWENSACSYKQQEEAIVKVTTQIQQDQQPIISPIQQKEQQSTVTTTNSISPFANITTSYIPPQTYTPPLLPTMPTAEELLRKLPGLEKLNVNDIKEETRKTNVLQDGLNLVNSMFLKFNNAISTSDLTGLGTTGLGGGNAYIAPVPMNIINSDNSGDLYNYILGNTISTGVGFASATLLTPGAPVFVFETATAIPGAIQALTLSDLADNAITGVLCSRGNQEACAAFTATALIPGPAGSVNLIADSIQDFTTSWTGTGSVINKIINNVPSPALFNPSSSFDSFNPTTLDAIPTNPFANVSTENLTPKIFDATNGNMPPATEITIPTKISNWWDEKIV
ncbi:MAG: hypothetical protein AAB559_02325, partial [Patescibacteria group bacterium]